MNEEEDEASDEREKNGSGRFQRTFMNEENERFRGP
jgi:hypothetical protein